MMRLDIETIAALVDLFEYAETDGQDAYSELFTDLAQEYSLDGHFNVQLDPEALAREVGLLDINPYLEDSRAEVLNAVEAYYL